MNHVHVFLRRYSLLCAVALAPLLLLSGCGKGGSDSAIQSDANGYICSKCNLRFCTEREVNAEFCPKCKDPAIVEVLGYVCDKDKHTTLAARSHDVVVCEKCQTPAPATRLPHQDELVAWGAAKQTRAEVCKH